MSVRERGNSWQIDIHFTKERHFATLKKSDFSYEEALQYEADLRKQLGRQSIPDTIDINSVYREYLQWVEKQQSPATLRIKRYLLVKHILPFFGRLTPERITEGLIDTYKRNRKEEIISATSRGNNRIINLELLTLRHLCKKMFGIKIQANLLPDEQALPVVLTKEEIKRFIDALEPWYRLLFMLIYQTGMRKCEVLNLKWGDINGNLVTVKGKGGSQRTLPVSKAIVKLIAWHRLSTGLMAKNAGDDLKLFSFVNIYKAIKRAKIKAGITKRIYPQLLRHSLGTHFIEAGGNIRMLQEILGLKDLTATQRYTHIALEQKRRALEMVTNGNKKKNEVKPVGSTL